MTLQTFLTLSAEAMSAATMENPRFEARALVAAALDLPVGQVLLQIERELNDSETARLQAWLTERLRGVPLAYLAGRKGFYKYEFYVEPGVLIPRPESELVVETALRRRPRQVSRIADLGCGSGCIGLSLLGEIPGSHLCAVDLSPIAARVTAANAKRLGFCARVRVVEADVGGFDTAEVFDIVVANPPYIAVGDTRVEAHVHLFEPHAALYAGPDGLSAVRSWSSWALNHLRPQGLFVCEFGAGQETAIGEILLKAGYQWIEFDRDLAGIPRVVSALAR